ncbi:histidine kinase [Streptomyces sp. NBC_00481]|uniref:sensor histidine kinase n=1 Tax=unclassified Streptomyces TaxID=2593676 RepID=UPI002DDAB3CC|nr:MULTISPECIES: histidine kinase [unclassified Streptomyces]WRZ00400.1 histidine kinase [Streptomyces sp. NBC_00481]
MTHSAPALLGPHSRRLSRGTLYASLGLLWLLDATMIGTRQQSPGDWLPMMTGTAATALVLMPERWLSTEWRAGTAAAGSLVVTASVAMGQPLPDWGLLETACLLILLARTCRSVERPGVAAVLSVALAVDVIDEPLRTEGTGITLTYPFLLTFAVGAAIGTGCYLRTLEARRARTVADARLAERLQLARELHDFVAHHVTGIIAQAHAADVIHQSAPDQVGPILRNIAEAGQQTMDSMRRLVRVLRDKNVPDSNVEYKDRNGSEDPGELLAGLTALVSWFCEQGSGAVARLEITAPARQTRLAPEVRAAIHRVVQEALTNVRRHAPGTQVTVRMHRTGDDLLRLDVHNTAPRQRTITPTGGHGGYGLIGLRETAYAVDGTFTAGPGDGGGWWVIAHFPTLPEPATPMSRPAFTVR